MVKKSDAPPTKARAPLIRKHSRMGLHDYYSIQSHFRQ